MAHNAYYHRNKHNPESAVYLEPKLNRYDLAILLGKVSFDNIKESQLNKIISKCDELHDEYHAHLAKFLLDYIRDPMIVCKEQTKEALAELQDMTCFLRKDLREPAQIGVCHIGRDDLNVGIPSTHGLDTTLHRCC